MYCIVTLDPSNWECETLGKALRKAGIPFFFASIEDFVGFNGKIPRVLIAGHAAEEIKKILIRSFPPAGVMQFAHRNDMLRRLEHLGIACVNPVSAIEKCSDKFYASCLLEDAGFRVPETVCCERYEDAYEAFLDMKDVVIKPTIGSSGKGIVRATDNETASRVLRTYEFHKFPLYVQEYLEHNNEDMRILVCRDEIVAAMRRKSDVWKTNIAQGARPEKYVPSDEIAQMALGAARTLGCVYCGVDVMVSNGEPYILEVNPTPGWRGLQQVADFSIAEALVESL